MSYVFEIHATTVLEGPRTDISPVWLCLHGVRGGCRAQIFHCVVIFTWSEGWMAITRLFWGGKFIIVVLVKFLFIYLVIIF